jgi:hypothetical protein
LEQSKRVPGRLRQRNATGRGRHLRLSVAPRRTTVTFSRTFDEADLIGGRKRNVGRTPAKPAFTGGEQTVPVSRRSATELGRHLRLSVAPRRTAVTFSRTFDEADLIGGRRWNVGRTPAKPRSPEENRRCRLAGGARRNWVVISG